jgi:hypothetical protein
MRLRCGKRKAANWHRSRLCRGLGASNARLLAEKFGDFFPPNSNLLSSSFVLFFLLCLLTRPPYLLELDTVHVRNVYDPATYRDGVIEAMISAFHARFPMHLDHAVHGVWLRRQFHLHIANRRSSFTKAVRAVLQQQAVGLPPRTDGGRPHSCHDIEWRAAMTSSGGPKPVYVVSNRASISRLACQSFASNVRQLHVKLEAKLRYSRIKDSNSTRQMSVNTSCKGVVKIPGKITVKLSVKCAALSRQKWFRFQGINAAK